MRTLTSLTFAMFIAPQLMASTTYFTEGQTHTGIALTADNARSTQDGNASFTDGSADTSEGSHSTEGGNFTTDFKSAKSDGSGDQSGSSSDAQDSTLPVLSPGTIADTTSTPEPGSLGLAAAGGLALFLMTRRRAVKA